MKDKNTAAILAQWCQPLQADASVPIVVLPAPGSPTQEPLDQW